jgi:hypothetical protein
VDRPFTSDEDAAAAANFPEMKHFIENTGDCGGQFQGEANAGHISRALHGQSYADSVVGVAIGIGHSLGFLPKKNTKKGLDYGASQSRAPGPLCFIWRSTKRSPKATWRTPRASGHPLRFKPSTPQVKHALNHPE